MKHLTDDTLWTMVVEPGQASETAHLESCGRCRARLEEWRTVREGLAELERGAVDDRELHRLAALYRARGPRPMGHTELWARLLRSSPLAPVSVRGAASPVLAEHGAGPYHVTVQVGEEAAGVHRLHGQVLADGAPVVGGEVVISDGEGRLFTGPIDELGEFDLEGITPGRYRASLVLEGARVVVEPLAVGTEDDT